MSLLRLCPRVFAPHSPTASLRLPPESFFFALAQFPHEQILSTHFGRTRAACYQVAILKELVLFGSRTGGLAACWRYCAASIFSSAPSFSSVNRYNHPSGP